MKEEQKKFPKHIVTVGAMITNNSNEVLMIKNPRRGWEIPGGQVEVGEDLITALRREVYEETGVKVEIINIVGLYSNIKEYEGYNGYETIPTILNACFIGKYVDGSLKTSSESIEVKWQKREKVLGLITDEVIYERVKDILGFNGKIKYSAYTKNPYKVHMKRDI